MSSSKLAKALKAKEEQQEARRRKASESSDEYKVLSTEDALKEALENKVDLGNSGGAAVLAARKRALLLSSRYDFLDTRELKFNELNIYRDSITEGNTEALADAIHASGETTPIIVREVPDGYEVVDGERRVRAHRILAERYGEFYYMIPARVFPLGTLSDDDALFMLHSANIFQRNNAMTPSEIARGFAAVADRIVESRKDRPEYKGRATRQILAAQLGVSERAAGMQSNIGHNLGDEGSRLYDERKITMQAADALAQLDVEQQDAIASKVADGSLDKADVIEAVAKLKGTTTTRTRTPKTRNQHVKTAVNALKRAVRSDDREIVSGRFLDELRALVKELEEARYKQIDKYGVEVDEDEDILEID